MPVAVYLLSLWALYFRTTGTPISKFSGPVTAVLILAAPLTSIPVLVVGLLLVVVVAFKVAVRLRSDEETFSA